MLQNNSLHAIFMSDNGNCSSERFITQVCLILFSNRQWYFYSTFIIPSLRSTSDYSWMMCSSNTDWLNKISSCTAEQ